MSTPFEIESFEDDLADGPQRAAGWAQVLPRPDRSYVSAGYQLKSSIGRYDHLLSKSLRERDEIECAVLEVFNNHLVTHVQHLPRYSVGGAGHRSASRLADPVHGLDDQPACRAVLSRCARRKTDDDGQADETARSTC